MLILKIGTNTPTEIGVTKKVSLHSKKYYKTYDSSNRPNDKYNINTIRIELTYG